MLDALRLCSNIYILKSNGLSSNGYIPWGRPINVDRVLFEPNGKEKTRLLLLKIVSNVLQNIGSKWSEVRYVTRVQILMESKAPRMSIICLVTSSIRISLDLMKLWIAMAMQQSSGWSDMMVLNC